MGSGWTSSLRHSRSHLGSCDQKTSGMKINWFCPLPPARTSIADDYLVGILPALSKHSELTLWTDQSSWDRSPESVALVRSYDPRRMSWPELNQADVTFYNIGNNHLFHTSIWQVSLKHSG